MMLPVHAHPTLGVEAGQPNPVTGGELADTWAELDRAVRQAAVIEDGDDRRVD